VVGGANAYPPHALVGRYDARTGRWRAAAPLPVGRIDHAAVTLADGRVLVTGGRDQAVDDLRSAVIYEPAADRWTEVAGMTRARTGHAMVRLQDGRVLAVGDGSGEVYDPRRGTWTAVAGPLMGFGYATATTLADGRVLVVGGAEQPQTYDPARDAWAVHAGLAETRGFHSATRVPDGRVLVIGGRVFDASGLTRTALASIEAFDPRTNTWSRLPPLRFARSEHSATLVGGVVVVAGGRPSGIGAERAIAEVEVIDAASGARTIGEWLRRPRESHSATALADGRVLVVGGRRRVLYSHWNLRWATRVRLRGEWRTRARTAPQGVVER
jgi:hypothetical protein